MTKLLQSKPFIIAEVGSNWQNFQQAKDSISSAAYCGADAVKFQAFNRKALYGGELHPGESYNPAYELPLDWLPKLKEKANACGIEFMCSAFSPELVDTVDPYVEVHKIASSEILYPHLLERVASKKKPTILSVGASSHGDIREAVKILKEVNPLYDPVLLYCVSAYPSRSYNLFAIDDLRSTHGLNVGFSDHSDSVFYPALSAVKHFGACVIEKHVNFYSTSLFAPDADHSLDSGEFKIMCDYLKGKRPYNEFQPQSEEEDMFLLHNRRLIATMPITKGDMLEYGVNFGAFRSIRDETSGLIPLAWASVDGRIASRGAAAGDGIGPAHIFLSDSV